MRFLLAGHLFGRGGIQTHLTWMARLLRARGHEVYGLTRPGDPGDQPCLGPGEAAGVCVYTARPAGRPAGAVGLRAAGEFVAAARPDVFFVVGTGWVGALLPWAAARGARTVFFEVMSGEPAGRLDPRWAVAAGFDAVVAQSARVARTFRRGFRWRRPVPVLPALPEPLERTAKLPQAAARRVPRGTARAGFFSRLVPHKRGLWLARQWDALKADLAELHVHGGGPEEPAVRAHVEAAGLGRRVFCHGPYPAGQGYVDLLAGYDLTVLPTVGAEGAPLVLLESMACGVPFVATGVGGVPDYANPDCRVAPAAPDTFVEATRDLVAALADGRVDQARLQRLYRDRYGFDRLGRAWVDYLERGTYPPDWAAA